MTGDEIAIIGMGGRFPRAAGLDAFWRNLREGIECTTEVTADDLRAAGLDPALLDDPDYVRHVFALEDPEHFDAEFFGFTPREAEWLDPQHRILLETAFAALEHAGYDPDRYEGLIGVFGGVGRNSYYLHALAARPELLPSAGEYHALIGNERDFPTTHISYRLNLRGPSMDVQTACSTSGVAVHLACQSLRCGECDLALAGGAKVIIPNRQGYLYVEGGPLAPEGHVRAFDADARGMVRGSGAAILALKRLDDALEDGDTVHAVVLGSAVNNDGGAKVGFTAPSVTGQAAVITEALASAGVTADSVSYVETHGTGTILGDPIEVAGLTEAFRQTTDRVGFCRIGSVKTNIGHLDAGATAAGIIKTVLAMRHEELPASLNFRHPNPEIDFAHSPFRVNAELTPWPRGAAPRRAGVSSFGLGGTNAHLVIEEPPPPAAAAAARGHHLLLLSARSPAALDALTDDLAHHLDAHPEQALADVAYTLQAGRRQLPHRRALACTDHAEAASALRSRDQRRLVQGAAAEAAPSVVYMFPGGGAQYPGMAASLFPEEPVFRDAVEECAGLMEAAARSGLQRFLTEGALADPALEQPSVALPALFAVEYALARLWGHWGLAPRAMIGHSMGEYTAACLAGVFSLADALRLVSCRGRLFETLPPGGMVSVPLSEQALRARMDERLAIAAVNRPDLCVASGADEAIGALAAQLEADGIDSTRIHIAVAAHSALVEPILQAFGEFVAGLALQPPATPFVSNVTGTWMTDADATDPAYWVRHLRGTVRFAEGMATLCEDPSRVFLEVGPGQTLSTFARQHPSRRPEQAVVASVRHPREVADDRLFLAQALGRMWISGVGVDWDAVQGPGRRRVPLPTYPYQRRRYSLVGDTPPLLHRAGAAPGTPIAASAETPVVPVAPAAVEPATRQAQIARELRRILQDLSGMDPARMNGHSTFLELGFDSLFLARANSAFKRRFKVRLTTRQLMEKTPTVEALATYLDELLPAGAGLEGDAADAPSPGATEPAAAARPDKTSPWQPVAHGLADGHFTPPQREWLDDLVRRVTSRTPTSKAMTQEHRSHLADPRTVQGFRRQWKDLVYPIVSDRAKGSKIWDVDGNEYIDLVNGYGVTFFGHSPDFILDAVRAQLDRTVAIGPQTVLAGEVARLVCEVTGMERAAFCNTGSEAVLAAIRVARTVTGKRKLATFAGHYHGIFDEVLVKGTGTGVVRKSVPIAPGIPASKVEDVVVLEYGNFDSLEQIRRHADDLALVMVEPVRSRNLDLQPREFVQALRTLTEELGIPLLFDEMVTGFRSHPGGAQAIYGIRADLATYGKIVGGEFPIGIVAGRREYMDALDGGAWTFGDDSVPEADMTWFAGTFVRHPLALAAARAVLTRVRDEGPALQEGLNRRTTAFVEDLNAHFHATQVPIHVEHFSSAFIITFTSFQEYAPLLFYDLHARGVYAYEGRPAFFTLAHTDADMGYVAASLKEAVASMQAVGLFPGGPAVPVDVPLAEGQQEIWLATLLGPDASRAFNLASTLDLEGPLNVTVFRDAVQDLVARHEALRAVPHQDGQTQRILPALTLDVPLIDLADLAPDERTRRLDAVRSAEVETAFDLVAGPLVRATLVRLAPDRHHAILTVHHLVCDGWSSAVLLRDLGALYEARRTGRPATLPVPMQLREFVQHSVANRTSPERAEAERYWLEQHADAVPVLELPTDRPRPPRKTFRARRHTVRVPEAFVARMKRLAAGQGSTLFATLLAGFGALLHRLTGQEDVVVGFSLAGQAAITDRDLVGHCVTFLPVRLRPEGGTPFDRFLGGVREQVLDAVEHQNLAFGGLLQRLRMKRDPSRVPLMSVAFNLDPSGAAPRFHDVQARAGSVPRRFENFDLFFNAVDLGNGRLELQCTFNLDLFDETTIARWVGQYAALLDAAADAPQTPLGALRLEEAVALAGGEGS